MAGRRAPGEKRWQLVRWSQELNPGLQVCAASSFTWYMQEGRFRTEERTLTAFQWLYSPQQHRILSRADLASPSRYRIGSFLGPVGWLGSTRSGLADGIRHGHLIDQVPASSPVPSTQKAYGMGKAMGIFGPPLVTRKLLCGASCQMGLWCNLLAEPFPELWVPLGVGKQPFVTSLPTVVPPGVQDTPLDPAASPTGSSTWGTGKEGGALPGAPPYTVAVTLLLLRSFSNNPRDFSGTQDYTAATMFHRKRSVSFGGFGCASTCLASQVSCIHVCPPGLLKGFWASVFGRWDSEDKEGVRVACGAMPNAGGRTVVLMGEVDSLVTSFLVWVAPAIRSVVQSLQATLADGLNLVRIDKTMLAGLKINWQCGAYWILKMCFRLWFRFLAGTWCH
ncbi:hypothetical protein STEG23_011105 [Scotinomys teguina]